MTGTQAEEEEIGIRRAGVLRRWYKAKDLPRVHLPRVEQATGQVSHRTSTVHKRLIRDNRGFVTVTTPCHGIATRPNISGGADQCGCPQ